MKKRISVEQVKFGVYVNELDRPWTDTPFMYQGFVVKTEQQVQALKKFCKTVVIDTDKGSDVAPLKPGGPAYSGPSVDRKSTRLNSSHSQQSRMPSSA